MCRWKDCGPVSYASNYVVADLERLMDTLSLGDGTHLFSFCQLRCLDKQSLLPPGAKSANLEGQEQVTARDNQEGAFWVGRCPRQLRWDLQPLITTTLRLICLYSL